MLNGVVICEHLLQWQKRKSFLHCIMTGDEMWIHYNPRRRRSWSKPGHASTSAAKPNIHDLKLLLCIWWDQLGIVYYELLKPTKTIKGKNFFLKIKKLITIDNAPKLSIKEKKNGRYLSREPTKWFCNMTTLGHLLQNGLKPTWKHLNGKCYPNIHCIH